MMPAEVLDELLSAYFVARAAGKDAALEELCKNHLELLPEVRRRIAAVDAVAKLTPDTGVSGDTTGYPSSSPAGAHAFPTRLGGYEVLKVLGEGGMGAVLLADDPALKRQVAIKVLQNHVTTDPVARDRFLREAHLAAKVSHDNVVAIFHIGEDAGVPYLVMPLLEGESLALRLCRDEALTPSEVCRIGRETAAGLAAAHAKGLVHRDIKPGNLWLEAPTGRVKVLDFGLARVADGKDGLTRTGAVLGTPGYMAPEQIDGKDVDARCDLFALGVVLYECATGTRPFRGGSLTAVLRAIAEHKPPPAHEVNPKVSPALSGLIMRLLAKVPDERPAAAVAVATELAAIEEQLKDAIEPAAVHRQAQSRFMRSRWLLGGVALVVLAAGVWLLSRHRDNPDTAGTAHPELITAQTRTTQPTPVVAPLHGSVDLLVYRVDQTGSDVLVPLSDPLAMPLRKGDHFKIVTEVNRPAFLYVFWVDENGVGVPVYPWTPGEWGTRPANEQPVPNLDITGPNGVGFRVTGDANGMETILMLARSTRLEASEQEIRNWFLELKPLPFRGEQARVWFENFDVLQSDKKRGFEIIGDVKAVDGPLGLQLALKKKIGSVELERAISFARIGKK
jgi:serine/threonine protein kinase